MENTFIILYVPIITVPQVEDEQVLQRYLGDLIADRNLEQVDLLLKFMFRLEHTRFLLRLQDINLFSV